MKVSFESHHFPSETDPQAVGFSPPSYLSLSVMDADSMFTAPANPEVGTCVVKNRIFSLILISVVILSYISCSLSLLLFSLLPASAVFETEILVSRCLDDAIFLVSWSWTSEFFVSFGLALVLATITLSRSHLALSLAGDPISAKHLAWSAIVVVQGRMQSGKTEKAKAIWGMEAPQWGHSPQ